VYCPVPEVYPRPKRRAGGIGFQLLTAMNLFQYREVSLLLIVIFVIVVTVERLSAALRQRLP
jgi:phosphonate transport system permease protein